MSNTSHINDFLTAAAHDAAIAERLLEQMITEGEGGEAAMLVLHQISRLRRELERGADDAHEQEISESVAMLTGTGRPNNHLLQQLTLTKGADDHEPVRA
ncbi:hypothetical protein [Aeromonas sp. R7-3]|jgi:hypothetical protein|uniref:hypothetical protein n=1 Tax=Aeromonas sp. R7-3 TaxID=3138475 RepID=UPI0034A26ECE